LLVDQYRALIKEKEFVVDVTDYLFQELKEEQVYMEIGSMPCMQE